MLPHSDHYEPYYMLGPKAHSGYLAISDPLGPLGPAGHNYELQSALSVKLLSNAAMDGRCRAAVRLVTPGFPGF